jgi:hypothetical protein
LKGIPINHTVSASRCGLYIRRWLRHPGTAIEKSPR